MPFDPSSATLVEGAGFDPATAAPVDPVAFDPASASPVGGAAFDPGTAAPIDEVPVSAKPAAAAGAPSSDQPEVRPLQPPAAQAPISGDFAAGLDRAAELTLGGGRTADEKLLKDFKAAPDATPRAMDDRPSLVAPQPRTQTNQDLIRELAQPALDPGLAGRYGQAFAERALPFGIAERAAPAAAGRAPAETTGERVAEAAGELVGTLASFVAPMRAVRALAPMVGPYQQFVGQLATRYGGKAAALADAGMQNIAAFNLHGQMQMPLDASWQDRVAAAKSATATAPLFTLAGQMGQAGAVGRVALPVALFALGAAGAKDSQDAVIKGGTFLALHYMSAGANRLAARAAARQAMQQAGVGRADIDRAAEDVTQVAEEALLTPRQRVQFIGDAFDAVYRAVPTLAPATPAEVAAFRAGQVDPGSPADVRAFAGPGTAAQMAARRLAGDIREAGRQPEPVREQPIKSLSDLQLPTEAAATRAATGEPPTAPATTPAAAASGPATLAGASAGKPVQPLEAAAGQVPGVGRAADVATRHGVPEEAVARAVEMEAKVHQDFTPEQILRAVNDEFTADREGYLREIEKENPRTAGNPTGAQDAGSYPAQEGSTPSPATTPEPKRRPAVNYQDPIKAVIMENGGLRHYRPDPATGKVPERDENQRLFHLMRRGGMALDDALEQLRMDPRTSGMVADWTPDQLRDYLTTKRPQKMSETAFWKQKVEQETEWQKKQSEAIGHKNLAPGDTFKIKGETFTVLEEGDTALRIADGIEYWVPYDTARSLRIDKGSLTKADDYALEQTPGDAFALEAQTPEQVLAERKALDEQAGRAAVAEAAAEPMTARGVDTTGDLFDPTKAEAPLFAAPTPKATADIEAAAKARARGGAVTLGNPDALRARWKGLKALFDPERGVGNETYDAYVRMQRELDAAVLQGRQDRVEIMGVVKGLEKAYGRQPVMTAIQDVQDGKWTPQDFGTLYQLSPTSPMVRTLEKIQAANVAREQMIATWSGLPEGMRDIIKDNATYQTRAYLRFILGDGYEPPAQQVQWAQAEVQDGLMEAVSLLQRQATAVRGKRRPWDVIRWMDTGDQRLLAGLSKTRAAAAQQLRKNYLEMRELLNGMVLNGNAVVAQVNANAMADAARGIVDYYLSRPTGGGIASRGGLDIANLQRRFLGDVFRHLYGEITDPGVRQAITAEVQGRMLAQMTFMNRLLQDGEGAVWARRPDPAKGFTQQLGSDQNPSDRKRYGDLAGRYVTPQLARLISPAEQANLLSTVVQRAWLGPMSVQRVAKLMNPKTVVRNYVTSITGFSLGSGDMLEPGWAKAFGAGHDLAVRFAAGQPKAIEEMRELYRLGVFRPGASTAVADVEAALGGAGAKMRDAARKVTTAYSFIDFPAKYAAYQVQRQAGLSAEQAAEHVLKYYQNRERIPEIVAKFSKTGMADYLSYTYDSGRIAINQVRRAVEQVRAGNVKPLVGLAMSRALWGMTMAAGVTAIGSAASAAHQWLRGDKDKRTLVDDATVSDLRMFLAPYDQSAPVVAWRERGNKDAIFYQVLGGQTAWPIDDIIIGALQSPKRGTEWYDGILTGTRQLADEGMYIDTWLRALTGEDLNRTRTPTGKGLLDVMKSGAVEPKAGQIVRDAAVGFAMDMLPAYPFNMLRRLDEMEQRQKSGQDQVGIFANTTTKEDVVAAGHRLVRTYRLSQTDMNGRIRSAVRPYVDAMREAKEMTGTATRAQLVQGGATAKRLEAADVGASAQVDYKRKLIEIGRAARSVAPEWYDNPRLMGVLVESGLGVEDAIQVVRGLDADVPDELLTSRSHPRIRPMQTRAYQPAGSGR